MPKRIQRHRTKGWRTPEGAICVSRPSRWGNPFTGPRPVSRFREYAKDRLLSEPDWLEPLRGHDLCCYCRLDCPCHGDVLLELANA